MNFEAFLKDVPHTIKKQEGSLKDDLLAFYNISNKIQNRIITLENYRALQFFSETEESFQKEIFEEINSLYEQFISYLDSDETEFLNGLKTNLPSRVFELVVADLTTRSGYELMDRAKKPQSMETADVVKKGVTPSKPDLWTKNFFVECTSINASFMADWCNLLPKFDSYWTVAKDILQKRTSKKYYDEPILISIDQIWPLLRKQDIEAIALRLQLDSALPSNIIRKILENWIVLNRHIKCWHAHLVPQKLLDRLSEININGLASISPHDYPFISKRIVKALTDKLQNKYFQEGHGIIAISTSVITQGLPLSEVETQNLVGYFCSNYEGLLLEAIGQQESEKQQAIFNGLNNLVAIILDTNWYNWFSSILKKHGQAQFATPQQNNFFYLLYDDKHVDHHKLIKFRETIHYHEAINLNPDILLKLLKCEPKEIMEIV